MLGWTNPKLRMWVWVVAGTGPSPRQGAEPTLLALCLWSQLSHDHGEGWGHLSWVWGLALPLLWPMRSRAGYPRVSGVGVGLSENRPGISARMVSMSTWDNTDHGHHYKPQLQQDHRLRYDPWQQPRLNGTMAPMWHHKPPDWHNSTGGMTFRY